MLCSYTKNIFLEKKQACKLSRNIMAQTLCILTLLCFTLCAVASAVQEQELDIQLQQDLFSPFNKLQEEVRYRDFVWYVY